MDQLELKESPQMTATEVNARMELMQRLIGPSLSRLESDLLSPLVKRTLNILWRYNMLPPMPKSITGEIDLEYTGPMARAQASDQVQALESYLASVGELSNLYPEMKHVPNPIESALLLAEMRRIPARSLHSLREIKAAIQREQEMMERAAAAEEASVMAEAGMKEAKGQAELRRVR